MNLLTVTGNLGRDAEVKSVGGSTVANFSVAMKSGYGQNEQTIWLDCALWGKQAEGSLPSYLVKGQKVCVSGELGTREHNGKTYLTLRVSNIDPFCGGKAEGGQQPKPVQQAAASPASDTYDDDIPFDNPYRGARSLVV